MYNFEHSAQVQMQSALRHTWQVEKMQKVLISILIPMIWYKSEVQTFEHILCYLCL